MHLLEQIAIFLLTAVLLVPTFQRLKLGAVLGYLVAGMLIGPWGLGVVGAVEQTIQFAEFGVVLLLFLIGLELDPARLWTLRRTVFGLGGAQVGVTGAISAVRRELFRPIPEGTMLDDVHWPLQVAMAGKRNGWKRQPRDNGGGERKFS